MITARAGLGIFAALVFPATLAIVTSVFTTPSERAAAVGIWSATAGVSVAVGPLLGGWLLEHFSWSSVFWVNVPMAVVAAAGVLLAVPDTSSGSVSRFDTTGLVLSIAGLGLLTYAMIEAPHFGWTDPRTIGGLVVAAAILGLFVRRELTTAHPILDIRLFANRYFATAAAMISVAFFALFGFIFLITQYFQAVKGYGPLEAGARTLPFAIVMAVFSPIAMMLSHRFGPRPVAVTGALSLSAGFALVEFAAPDSSYWGLIIEAMALMAVGLAFISGPCTQMIMDALSPEQAGAGSAVNDTTRELGGTLGVAVLGSVLTSVYAATVGDRLTDLGVPAGPVHAARDSVMAGVEVAGQAPGTVSGRLEDVVRQVFVEGLHSAVWVAVAVTAAAAIAAVGLLRGAPSGRDRTPAQPVTSPRAATGTAQGAKH